MSNLIAELDRLIKAAGLRVTFDSDRDATRPCWICGDHSAPWRALVVLGNYLNRHRDPVIRPVCEACRSALGIPERG